jgi:hypothetical protein
MRRPWGGSPFVSPLFQPRPTPRLEGRLLAPSWSERPQGRPHHRLVNGAPVARPGTVPQHHILAVDVFVVEEFADVDLIVRRPTATFAVGTAVISP